MTAEPPITFDYEISFSEGKVRKFHIELDPVTFSFLPSPAEKIPEWAILSHCQCEVCPLNTEQNAYCPVAKNLFSITDVFAGNLSYEEVDVTILTPSRNYQRKIPLQNALRSLFGILMATSGCPVLDKLRPMVVTHLPFATITETAYRAFSMYALAQCFIQKNGGVPDWEFKNLGEFYQKVEKVNQAFHQRLVSAGFEDASLNAITNLNCYSQYNRMLLEPQGLKRIENLFTPYL